MSLETDALEEEVAVHSFWPKSCSRAALFNRNIKQAALVMKLMIPLLSYASCISSSQQPRVCGGAVLHSTDLDAEATGCNA